MYRLQSKQDKEATPLFHEMHEAKVNPNEITFIGVLSACFMPVWLKKVGNFRPYWTQNITSREI
jgi:hypothetical protein